MRKTSETRNDPYWLSFDIISFNFKITSLLLIHGTCTKLYILPKLFSSGGRCQCHSSPARLRSDETKVLATQKFPYMGSYVIPATCTSAVLRWNMIQQLPAQLTRGCVLQRKWVLGPLSNSVVSSNWWNSNWNQSFSLYLYVDKVALLWGSFYTPSQGWIFLDILAFCLSCLECFCWLRQMLSHCTRSSMSRVRLVSSTHVASLTECLVIILKQNNRLLVTNIDRSGHSHFEGLCQG